MTESLAGACARTPRRTIGLWGQRDVEPLLGERELRLVVQLTRGEFGQ